MTDSVQEDRVSEALEYLHEEVPAIRQCLSRGDVAKAEVLIALELRRTDLELDVDTIRAIRQRVEEKNDAAGDELPSLEVHEFPRNVAFVSTFNPENLPQTTFTVDAQAAYKLSDRAYDGLRLAKQDNTLRSDQDFRIELPVNPRFIGECIEFMQRGKDKPVPRVPPVGPLTDWDLRHHTDEWVAEFVEEFKATPGCTNDDLFSLATTAGMLGVVELAVIMSADMAIKIKRACQGVITGHRQLIAEATKRWASAWLLFDPARAPREYHPREVVHPAVLPARIYRNLSRHPHINTH